MDPPLAFAVLTVSDRCSRGESIDKSGPALEVLILKSQHTKGSVIKERNCVPDDVTKISELLRYYSSEGSGIDVILTTGGTGFSPRDVTPEATETVIQRRAPAITAAITRASLMSTPFAMLYRGVTGIANTTLIVNLPGSVRGCQECFAVIAPIFAHAVALLRNDNEKVSVTHQKLSVSSKVLEGNIAERPRESVWPMLSVKESQAIVLASAPPPELTTVTLLDGLGKVLACDIFAKDPLPPFPASIKDGYAVLSINGKGLRKVVASCNAGMEPGSQELKSGECVRVNTGCPIPLGADAVIQVEDTKLVSWHHVTKEEEEIEILISPSPGLDIRSKGSDIGIGELVLEKSSILGSTELGVLATVGVTCVPVFKSPTVSVISTGNELVEPTEDLKPGKIRDSNKTVLLSLLRENGFVPLDMGIAEDRPSEILRILLTALDSSDFVVTTGSVSMGDKDYLKQVLCTDLEAHIHFGRVNLKPGKPTTFATCIGADGRHKMIFCLPGNPVSAAVTFHLYVLPALRQTGGHSNPFPSSIKVRLSEEMKLDIRPEYKRVILDWSQEDGVPLARTTGNQISSRLLSWCRANCLLVLPSSKEYSNGIIPAHSLVEGLMVGHV